MLTGSVVRGVAATVAVGAVAAVTTLGAAHAHAVVGPKVAVAASGTSNWQLTYQHGDALDSSCVIHVGKTLAITGPGRGTTTIAGSDLRPGRYPVQVRCGSQSSPTIWIYAPRGQINDLGTWASNTTAGVLGI